MDSLLGMLRHESTLMNAASILVSMSDRKLDYSEEAIQKSQSVESNPAVPLFNLRSQEQFQWQN